MTDYTDRVCPRCNEVNLKPEQDVCETCASRNGKRGRRICDEAQHVLVDSFLNGAKKKINRIEKIAGSALLVLVLAFGGVMWRGGTWTKSIEEGFTAMATRDSVMAIDITEVGADITDVRDMVKEHKALDDARVSSLAAAVAEIDKTMAVIVANQESLRRQSIATMEELARRRQQ